MPADGAITGPRMRASDEGQLARDVQASLTPAERLSLVSDEWALVRAGPPYHGQLPGSRHPASAVSRRPRCSASSRRTASTTVEFDRRGPTNRRRSGRSSGRCSSRRIATRFRSARRAILRIAARCATRSSARWAVRAEDAEVIDKATRAVANALARRRGARSDSRRHARQRSPPTHGDAEMFDLLTKAAGRRRPAPTSTTVICSR